MIELEPYLPQNNQVFRKTKPKAYSVLKNLLTLSPLVALCFSMASCSSTPPAKKKSGAVSSATRISSVRTTAYTHSESDHIQYGATTATGDQLKYGRVRSAATDWSVYPVGTLFQIEGEPNIYEVDDYGSALVGTNTIDLYKPDKSEMRNWGVRNVNIRVIKWGSFTKSLAIMRDRTRNDHVRKMVQRIERSS
jgi:3D (Asp-Asp-Asp) domain-containing protein